MGTRKLAVLIAFGSMVGAGEVSAQTTPPGGGAAEAPGDSRPEQVEKRKCYAEFENAQIARQAGRLRDARASLVVCSSNACPSIVQADCVDWLGQVTKSLPTIVLAARLGKRDEFNVRVFIDGQLLVSRLDGKAMAVDPGAHTFRFELPPYRPIEERVLITVGEKERSIAVTFDTGEGGPGQADGRAGPAVDEYRPIPKMVYVLGGVSLAGLAGFTALGLAGQSQKSDLMNQCAPFCKDSDVSPVRTKLLIGDISLGLAVASATAAVVFYVTRPSVPVPKTEARNGFVVSPIDRGAAVLYRKGF